MTDCTTDEQCNNHGTCTNSKCICVENYIGTTCNQCLDQNADPEQNCDCKIGYTLINGECTSNNCINKLIVCNQQGHCINDKCQCDVGLTGDLCTDCDTSKGLFANTTLGCLKVCYGKCQLPGFTCVSGLAPRESVCSCANENFDPKQQCKHCVKGFSYIDGECISNNCIINDTICSGRGACSENKCQCFGSYESKTCETCKADTIQSGQYCLHQCSADDKCMKHGFTCQTFSSQKACGCSDINADPDHNCILCQSGFKQTILHGCQPEECVNGRKLCSSNGTCEGKACVCTNSTFIGTYCEQCTENKIQTIDGKCIAGACLDRFNQLECGGNGNCVLDQGNNACVCKPGYEGHLCQQCKPGYKQFEGKCFKSSCFEKESNEPCNLNGTCTEQGSCKCDGAAFGRFCEACHPAFTMLENGECIPKSCLGNNLECNNKGFCLQKEEKCACQLGYDPETNCVNCIKNFTSTNNECVSNQCISRMSPLPCSGKGSCQEIDLINNIIGCFCNPGYIGRFCDDCDENLGFVRTIEGKCANLACMHRSGTESYECSGNGRCVNPTESVWACECRNGATGKLCSDCGEGFVKLDHACVFETCVAGKEECNGHGTCRKMGMSHQCICRDGFANEGNCMKCLKGFGFHAETGTCMEGAGEGENKANVGMIVGIVIGVVLLLVAIGLVVFFVMKKKGSSNGKSKVPRDLQNAQKFSI